MGYEILVLPSAEKELRRLPRKEITGIIHSIDSLARQPRPRGVQKLHGSKDRYRIRRGRYRILYRVDDAAKRVMVYSVADRKDAYR
jgi:mRNA interferase RelE/StbE